MRKDNEEALLGLGVPERARERAPGAREERERAPALLVCLGRVERGVRGREPLVDAVGVGRENGHHDDVVSEKVDRRARGRAQVGVSSHGGERGRPERVALAGDFALVAHVQKLLGILEALSWTLAF